MGKRTNQFQQLVHLVKQQVADGASVNESELLIDQRTGENIEVDVCIRTRIGGHDVLIGIECQKTGRPATREWVNEMVGKHASLPTHILALASGSGFTKGAKLKATAEGVELINLETVDADSWKGILDHTDSLWAKAFSVTPTKVYVLVETSKEPPLESVLSAQDTSIFLSDGAEVSCVGNLVNVALRAERFAAEFLPRADSTHKFFEFGFPVPAIDGKRLCLKCLDPDELRPIQSIKIIGSCNVETSPFPLKRGYLGKVAVTWSSGKFLGDDALIVATTDDEGNSRFSIRAKGIPCSPLHVNKEALSKGESDSAMPAEQ